MRRKTVLVTAVSILIFALAVPLALSKEQDTTDIETKQIVSKLDQILTNQTQILEQFEAVKQELAIIKVRSSR